MTRVELMRHEISHGVAFLRSGVPQVMICPADDGVHWWCVPIDIDNVAHPDADRRSTVAGHLVGTPSKSDREALAEIDPAELPALEAWCRKHVLPAVAEFDAFEICRMIQEMLKTGGILMKGPQLQ